jgi:23S rRNA (pseudouridine1915-N3)-methyltransferase
VKIVVVAAGRIRDKAMRSVADDYLGRIRHYARCDETEVKSAGELERRVPEESTLVVLTPEGDAVTSRELARRLERWGANGKGVVSFVLGAADGIPGPLVKRAHARLSLSTLTLPHRLARVVLFEQIYRAFTISRGEPYARED